MRARQGLQAFQLADFAALHNFQRQNRSLRSRHQYISVISIMKNNRASLRSDKTLASLAWFVASLLTTKNHRDARGEKPFLALKAASPT